MSCVVVQENKLAHETIQHRGWAELTRHTGWNYCCYIMEPLSFSKIKEEKSWVNWMGKSA